MNKQSELDKRYIRMASIWAENSYCQRRKVGALIVKDKMIISDGTMEPLPVSRTFVKTKTMSQSHTCSMQKQTQ